MSGTPVYRCTRCSYDFEVTDGANEATIDIVKGRHAFKTGHRGWERLEHDPVWWNPLTWFKRRVVE